MQDVMKGQGPAHRRRVMPRADGGGGERGTWLLLGPALLFLTVFAVWPFCYLIYASFTSYQMAIPVPIHWVGLGNFEALVSTARFWHSLGVTAAFALVSVPLQLLIGLGIALLLNGISRGRELYASLLLTPMMLAPIVVGFAWELFLNPIYGPLNALLKAIGLSPPAWAQSPAWALPTLVIVDIWQWTPLVMVILLAGLRSIPTRVYEAAKVDGSSAIQTFLNVVAPMLLPYFAVAFVLRFIDSFKVFDIIYILTRGGPGTITQNLAYYTYDLGFGRFQFGRSGALSIIQLLLLTFGTMLIIKVLAKRNAPPSAQTALPAKVTERV
ncbi:sugar ABC transporter permease [Acidisoma cellulosilytica]|uniref:Sugar ABC transporter permease n=1 Tax=Acidisoma cellulosilyticum TaxID=2802395 RepID=A0A964E5J9_9PROT|nr:sugar ABC transporter permease [Acidisoma cellulosilyticum]MCB8882601.1 sugar ABC transporter permease [Acidisoma cellulosilyticum]